MENFHSTKDLIIERNKTFGSRIVIDNVKNCSTKNGKFATVVSPDIEISKGDLFRLFFEKLDRGEVKNQQGAVLRCDKKDLYWFDLSEQFPKGISADPFMSKNGVVYFKFKTYRYLDGVKQQGCTYYRSAGFEEKIFPEDCATIQARARYVKEHLNELMTYDGRRVLEYVADCFDRVPAVDVPRGSKYPKNIEVMSVSSAERKVKAYVTCRSIGRKSFVFDLPEDALTNLYKPLYSYSIAEMICKGVDVDGGRLEYDPEGQQYVFTAGHNADSIKKELSAPSPVQSDLSNSSPVIADPYSDRAKSLLNKRVYGSHSFKMTDKFAGVLEAIDLDHDLPFKVNGQYVAFIKEASQPKLECYDFNKPEVRKGLFGKIFKNKSNTREEMVVSFKVINDRWVMNDKITAYDLMSNYVWYDDSECGVISVKDEV